MGFSSFSGMFPSTIGCLFYGVGTIAWQQGPISWAFLDEVWNLNGFAVLQNIRFPFHVGPSS